MYLLPFPNDDKPIKSNRNWSIKPHSSPLRQNRLKRKNKQWKRGEQLNEKTTGQRGRRTAERKLYRFLHRRCISNTGCYPVPNAWSKKIDGYAFKQEQYHIIDNALQQPQRNQQAHFYNCKKKQRDIGIPIATGYNESRDKKQYKIKQYEHIACTF